ncbi:MarR family winged helix-turn-helix transcriptional regulator [Butyricicoccus sp.]|uniref:MarR family winged helix-turn-helix transcriptional regulator n=1 Tax=Butyricicoccus sp. TaxID=2049021 RepID=UPI003F158FC3
MNQRFEAFVTSITQIYRCIQKIKAREMKALGLKSTHVMCLFQMQQHPEGLTAAQLSTLCGEDKGAVSRALSELEARGLAAFADQPGRKRYRTESTLTDAGRQAAARMNISIETAVETGGRGLTDEDRRVLYHALGVISNNLQAACTEQGEEL